MWLCWAYWTVRFGVWTLYFFCVISPNLVIVSVVLEPCGPSPATTAWQPSKQRGGGAIAVSVSGYILNYVVFTLDLWAVRSCPLANALQMIARFIHNTQILDYTAGRYELIHRFLNLWISSIKSQNWIKLWHSDHLVFTQTVLKVKVISVILQARSIFPYMWITGIGKSQYQKFSSQFDTKTK